MELFWIHSRVCVYILPINVCNTYKWFNGAIGYSTSLASGRLLVRVPLSARIFHFVILIVFSRASQLDKAITNKIKQDVRLAREWYVFVGSL